MSWIYYLKTIASNKFTLWNSGVLFSPAQRSIFLYSYFVLVTSKAMAAILHGAEGGIPYNSTGIVFCFSTGKNEELKFEATFIDVQPYPETGASVYSFINVLLR